MRARVIIVCGLFVLGSFGCTGRSAVDDLELGGVRITRMREARAPMADRSAVALMPGDFVISGGGLRVVIAGQARKPELRGAILEALGDGMSPYDSISSFSQTLVVRGAAHRIRVLRMQIVERRGRAALHVDGLVQLEDQVIDVARELTVAQVGHALSITTRFTARKDEPKVGLRTRIAWGGAEPQGTATLDDASWHEARWVGSEGATGATLFALDSGSLALRARYEPNGSSRLLEHTDIVQAQRPDLTAGVPHDEKALLSVADDGLGHSVRRLGFWRGAPFPEVWVTLPHHPAGSEAHLLDDQSRLLLRARADARGQVVLPLMAADRTPRFKAFATAFGHAPSDVHVWNAGERAAFDLHIPKGGSIRVHARELGHELALPVRVRILPLAGTPMLALGPDDRAAGAGDTVVTSSGDAEIQVPAGRYGVLVTHGPEWSTFESEVDVTDTFSPRIDARLEHQVDPGSWIACDLHVHSAPSPDSDVTLQDRLVSLHAEGIGFAVPTDHDHVTDFTQVAQQLGLTRFATVSGIEITTPEPSLGHFNVYPYPRDPSLPGNGAPDSAQVVPAKLFRALHALGPDVIVQVNHPRMEGGIGYFDVVHLDAVTGLADAAWSSDFDAMEVWNGFDLARPTRTEHVFGDWLAILARGQRVVATASSDSHHVRYQLAGYPRTYADVEHEGPIDPLTVVRAIKAGRTFLSSGPFLQAEIAGVGPGGTAAAQNGMIELAVEVRVPDWMSVERLEVFVGTERVIDRKLDAVIVKPKRRAPKPGMIRYAADSIALSTPQDTFVIVRVSSTRPLDRYFGRNSIVPMAFTNPIFVDADADGRTAWSAP